MKRIGLVLVILAAVAVAQQAPIATPAAATATYSDVYCAGFITNQLVPTGNFAAAAWDTPHQVRFATREYIYLAGGGYKEGAEYAVVRHLHDINRFEAYPGQHAAVAALGEPYEELARVKIVATEGTVGIAQVIHSCDAITPGDLVVPFVEKTIPALRSDLPFYRFAPANGKLSGRIVLAKDFDYLIGTRGRVYLDVGADKGVKVGDYFLVTRTYQQTLEDPVDYLSYKASIADDTQTGQPTFPSMRVKELPRMALGQMVIVGVTPKSATGMITFALDPIQVGDMVEMMVLPPPPPPPAPPAMNPPTLSCMASPATVRPGENSTITCQGSSPDNRPLSYAFSADRGQLNPQDSNAVLGTAGLTPGPVVVTSTVTDDRNLSASAMNMVSVEVPPAPPAASKLADINFKRGSAYVDNKAKAILDDVALRLQRESDATAVVMGQRAPKEAKSLAMQRANNVKRYLTRSKGIDPGRIETRAGTGSGMQAEVWIVPAGAPKP